MKQEIKDLNNSMEEIGGAIRDTAHVPADIYTAIVPIVAGAITVLWKGSRVGTEAIAGGIDVITDKASGKE